MSRPSFCLLTHSEVFDVGGDGLPLDHFVRAQVLPGDGALQRPAQVRGYLALVECTLALMKFDDSTDSVLLTSLKMFCVAKFKLSRQCYLLYLTSLGCSMGTPKLQTNR